MACYISVTDYGFIHRHDNFHKLKEDSASKWKNPLFDIPKAGAYSFRGQKWPRGAGRNMESLRRLGRLDGKPPGSASPDYSGFAFIGVRPDFRFKDRSILLQKFLFHTKMPIFGYRRWAQLPQPLNIRLSGIITLSSAIRLSNPWTRDFASPGCPGFALVGEWAC